jgi:hypothetical protein
MCTIHAQGWSMKVSLMWGIFTLHAINDLTHDGRGGSCMRTLRERWDYKRYEIRIVQACTQPPMLTCARVMNGLLAFYY